MTVPSAIIRFARGAVNITLSSPAPGYEPARERAQTIGESADGTPYVYDKNVLVRMLILPLVVTGAERSNLESFFDTTIKAALYTFTYTDHLRVSHVGCRFKTNKLNFRKTAGARWEVTLELYMPDDAG